MKRNRQAMKTMNGLAYSWPSLMLTAGIFIVWEAAMRTGWINPIYLAAPTGIIKAFWELVYTGEIWKHAYISTFRFGSGLIIGSLVGIAVGILTGGFETFRRSLEPLINALYGAPKIAILPLLILLMGIGEAPKVAIIAFTTFFSLA